MLVVFDIDGTLANIDHRLKYVRSKPKNWKAFIAGIPQDTPNAPVVEAYKRLDSNHNVIIATGRNEAQRGDTVRWLLNNKIDGWENMYMRADGDYRSDAIVKKEFLDQMVEKYGQKPDMVFDDRPQVVRMWRENGVFVFDCYQGTKDF